MNLWLLLLFSRQMAFSYLTIDFHLEVIFRITRVRFLIKKRCEYMNKIYYTFRQLRNQPLEVYIS